jgi:hypothetical protein
MKDDVRRLDNDIELAPVVWLETGLIRAGHPPLDAAEPVWRRAHQERLTQMGVSVPLLWGRPPWARLTDLPESLPEGVRRSDRGIALIHDGVAVVLPTCCTDFEDIARWKEIVDATGDKWEMLWIGHPWINWRRQGSDVLLSDYCEDDPVAATTATWAVPSKALRDAVAEAEALLARLPMR